MSSVVHCNDAETVLDEKAHPAGVDPVVLHARGKPVDQQDGLAATLIDEGDLRSVRIEDLHAFSRALLRAVP
jgi:hypothetical protein